MSPHTAPGDPNFPQGLRIQPSSTSKGKDREATSQPAAGQGTRWDKDTAQDIETYGIAGRIWEAAYLMAAYLRPPTESRLRFDPPCSAFASAGVDCASDDIPGPSNRPIAAVELGSGAGFGGLHFARQLNRYRKQHPRTETQKALRSDTVVLTDLPNVVSLMERNATSAGLFRPALGSQAEEPVQVLVRPLAWGDRGHASSLLQELRDQLRPHEQHGPRMPPLTHVLCSDLVYFPELLPPLLRSLIDLTEGKDGSPTLHQPASPEVVISYKIRSLIKEQPFWSAFGAWFDYKAVDCRRRVQEGAAASMLTAANGDDEHNEWHRFGSRASDLLDDLDVIATGKVGEEASAGVDEAADELFIFVAQRRPETFGCKAPRDDAALMLGKRLRQGAAGSEIADTTPSCEDDWHLEDGASGQDLFEWILLSGMGADL